MPYEIVDDPVDVSVDFAQRRVRPRVMNWHGRDYEIKQVNLVHAAHEGTKRVFYFSVSDLANYFKLKLDPEILEWRLVEVYMDGA